MASTQLTQSTSTSTEGLSAPSYVTWRYHTDPEFRERIKAQSHEYVKARRIRDPEYDEKLKQRWREYARAKRQDPEKVAREKESQRQYNLRKKAAKQAAALIANEATTLAAGIESI